MRLRSALLLVALLAAVLAAANHHRQVRRAAPLTTANGSISGLCERVIDGDTIVLAGGEHVRYIGIDTPEAARNGHPAQRMADEATQLNRRLVEGRPVRIALDVRERDRYGRLLGYVYVRDEASGDEVFVNAELVKAGYAQVYTLPPDVRYSELLLELERQAREQGRGLWGKHDAPVAPADQP